MKFETTAGLTGPSKTIVVEPTEQPARPEPRREAPARPAPAKTPDREPVPA
jgi:hypothetical protein